MNFYNLVRRFFAIFGEINTSNALEHKKGIVITFSLIFDPTFVFLFRAWFLWAYDIEC